ncbi:MAG: hypothetical protein EON87_06430 [Brevundimonas sp.]|nr:MAG: hypothetical protein EON87_06430 [Brevundimonas sp.]
MSFSKPFHRNVRGIKSGPNSGYSGWAYIIDPEYAKEPSHYVRAYLLIQEDLKLLFEYVEPSDEARATYSYRIHALFMRTCIEIEANFKAILAENTFSLPSNRTRQDMRDYRKVDATHHLSSYEVMLPIWNGTPPVLRPFIPWLASRGVACPEGAPLPWYQAYNASKHDRQDQFRKANLENLLDAVAALLILLASQFKDEDFSAASRGLDIGSEYDPHPMEPALGSLFRIRHPDDWEEHELYEFNWSELKTQSDRFNKIDFNAVPY